MSKELIANLRERAGALNAQIKALRDETAELVKPLLQEFITQHPQVKLIKWNQYTPYFNDGDPCVFRLGEVYFYFEGDDVDEDEGYSWFPDRTGDSASYGPSQEACSDATYAACDELSSLLNGMEDVLESLFGDGVQIEVTADGVDVNEYYHD